MKVGDIVRGKKGNGCFITNENMYKAEIISFYLFHGILVKVIDHKYEREIGNHYSILDIDVELIESPFTKSDLRTGDCVELNSGLVLRVFKGSNLDDFMECNGSWIPLSAIPENLNEKTIQGNYVVKVVRTNYHIDFSINPKCVLNDIHNHIIFERKEEPEILELTIDQVAEKFNHDPKYTHIIAGE